MEFTLPYLPVIDYNPFIFNLFFFFFQIYDALKTVSIHKRNIFGIKNWPMLFFVGVNGIESKEEKNNN
jgi:hypothetical protein